ncbi:hypothetical protein mRhiFer1_009702 [Rhinolophus ferrumequinum]|uniref:Uncharacterized protein n=1 Tax=Rhinolophus ferrumequinum TaxID=59479 RepID=A0A7J7R152_RHIFE|nr:hypothetical protein mRhiFer1_009702 [Rhinolophus ferrumequinum]
MLVEGAQPTIPCGSRTGNLVVERTRSNQLSHLRAQWQLSSRCHIQSLVAGGAAHHPLWVSRNRTGNLVVESPLAHVGIELAAFRVRSMELQPPEPPGRPNNEVFNTKNTIPLWPKLSVLI